MGTFRTRQEALNALANYKFKGEPVKSVYAAAYKNLADLHEQTFFNMEIVATNYVYRYRKRFYR